MNIWWIIGGLAAFLLSKRPPVQLTRTAATAHQSALSTSPNIPDDPSINAALSGGGGGAPVRQPDLNPQIYVPPTVVPDDSSINAPAGIKSPVNNAIVGTTFNSPPNPALPPITPWEDPGPVGVADDPGFNLSIGPAPDLGLVPPAIQGNPWAGTSGGLMTSAPPANTLTPQATIAPVDFPPLVGNVDKVIQSVTVQSGARYQIWQRPNGDTYQLWV